MSAPPPVYQKYVIMDILHKTEEEVRAMEILEYKQSFIYSWATYTTRRVDLLIKAFAGDGNNSGSGHRALPGKGDKMVWEHPKIQDYIKANRNEGDIIKDRILNKMSYIPARK